MTRTAIVLIIVLAAAPFAAAIETVDTGFVFGPWKYFAPYYFPISGQCAGICFTPADFVPKYESPNPPAPGPYEGPVMPPPPKKVSAAKSFGPLPPAERYNPAPRSSTPAPRTMRPIQSPSPKPRIVDPPPAGKSSQ